MKKKNIMELDHTAHSVTGTITRCYPDYIKTGVKNVVYADYGKRLAEAIRKVYPKGVTDDYFVEIQEAYGFNEVFMWHVRYFYENT
ncbi:MAG: hypothetical protein LBM95_04385 [Lactobacillales bacterium]|nr:hypothetical protein [Lactobacillales bacterium]